MVKKVLITGGSGGIGKQTAIALAKEGYYVIITGRSLKSCNDALAEIEDKSNSHNIDYIIADFNSMNSLQSLVDEYLSKHYSLDILINNVGYLNEQKEFTEDGLEKSFFINALAPYVLSNLFLGLLSKGSSGKIITLSGGMHPRTIQLDNLQAEKSFLGIVTYSHSKLVMMALMIGFGNTLGDTKVRSNICYPGQASTAMTNSLTPKMFPRFFRLFFPFLKFANRIDIKNPDKSAKIASKSTLYLALNTEAQIFHNCYINYKCEKVGLPNSVTKAENQNGVIRYANSITNKILGIDFINKK